MRPFFVITPLGLARADALCTRAGAIGAAIVERTRVAGWPALATRLYLRNRDAEALARAHAYELAWSAYGDFAEVVALASTADHRALIAAKRALRREFSSQMIGALSLHAFHVPDEDRRQIEHAIIADHIFNNASS